MLKFLTTKDHTTLLISGSEHDNENDCTGEDEEIGRGERMEKDRCKCSRGLFSLFSRSGYGRGTGTGTRTGKRKKKEYFPSHCQSKSTPLQGTCKPLPNHPLPRRSTRHGEQPRRVAAKPSQIHRNKRPAAIQTHVAVELLLGTGPLSDCLDHSQLAVFYHKRRSSRCNGGVVVPFLASAVVLDTQLHAPEVLGCFAVSK